MCVGCAQQHRFSYNEPMPVESCTQALSDLALRFGEDDDEEGGMVRAHCLIWPLTVPQLFAVCMQHSVLLLP